jgi:hypothetical protein
MPHGSMRDRDGIETIDYYFLHLAPTRSGGYHVYNFSQFFRRT